MAVNSVIKNLIPLKKLILISFFALIISSFSASTQITENITDEDIFISRSPEVKSYVGLCKAVYWQNIGDNESAKDQLISIINLNPDSSFLYTKLTEVLISLQKYRDAASACRRAIELNDNNAEAHYFYGLLNRLRTDPRGRQDSIREFKKVAELKPEHYRAQYYLSSMLFEDGDYAGAAKAYSELVKVRPYDEKLRFRLGICYSRSGENQKAIKEMEAAVKIDKNYMEPHFHLAYLYANQSRNKEAIRECMFVLSISPQEPNMKLLLSDIYVSMNEFEKAIPMAKGVIQFSGANKSNLAEAYYRLANAYQGIGQKALAKESFSKSIETYKEILRDDKENIGINYDIAMVYDAMGEHNLAEKHLRKYIRLEPNEPNTYNLLGYMFVEAERNLEEATDLIKKAVEMEPKNGAFRDSLGWAYYKMGDLDKSIQELEKAVEYIPNDSEVREHLGEVYLKKGGAYVEKAIKEWEKALQMKPKDIDLQKKLVDLRQSIGKISKSTEEM